MFFELVSIARSKDRYLLSLVGLDHYDGCLLLLNELESKRK
jgi:hypothetical protein